MVTHPPRKTRFRLLVRLYRTGLVTRRVPFERFQASNYPPFPSFLGARSDVFACQYVFDVKYHSASRWLLLFFNTILIEVLTHPPNGIEALIADEEPEPTSGLILPSSDSATGASAP